MMLTGEQPGSRNLPVGMSIASIGQPISNSPSIRTIIIFYATGRRKRKQISQNSDYFSSLVKTNMATMSIDDL